MRDYNFYVYILSNKSHTTYVGVTNDLQRRIWQHKNEPSGFVAQYRFTRLVYFEWYRDIRQAIEREHQIKGWSRAKKTALIQSVNSRWADLEVAALKHRAWFDRQFPM